MEFDKFIEAIRKGESQTVEFCQGIHKEMAKNICAFLNTDGGTIVVGASDAGDIIGIEDKHKSEQTISNIQNSIIPTPKNVKIDSIDLSKLGKENKWVFLIEIEAEDKLYSYKNVVYIRAGMNVKPLTINELVEKASESLLVFFDEQKTKVDKSQISKKVVEKYLELRERKRGVKNGGFSEDILQKLKIIKNDKATNGGLLFFSEDPQEYIPYARVRLIVFEREGAREYSDYKEFNGPIWKILEDLENYFLLQLKVYGKEITSFQREEYLEYPIIAIRESLANALIHRNYFDPSEIFVMIYPNKLVIRNPGAFPAGVNTEFPIHKPRNPLLSTYLYDMGYIEKWGSGIKKIKQACNEHPIVKVIFNLNSCNTEVCFVKDTIKAVEKLDVFEKQMLQLFEEKSLSSGKICEITGLSKPTVVKKINTLLAFGLVRKIGSGPKLTYIKNKLEGENEKNIPS